MIAPAAVQGRHAVELARIDHGAAAEYILTDLETGGSIQLAPMHWEWHDGADDTKMLVIEAPRDHGKTEQMIISRAISELGRNPEVRIKIVCENDELAKARVSAIGRHITHNPKVREVWPHLRPAYREDWSKHKLVVMRKRISKDGSVEAYGVLTNAGGGRADILMGDDLCGFRNTIVHPAEREQVKEAWKNVWLNMLEPTGHCIYIFTPWHKNDLSAELKVNSGWKTVSYAVDGNFKGPWPEKWSAGALETKLQEIGLRAYQRGYQLMALTSEEALFSEEMLESAHDWEKSLGDSYPLDWPRIAGIDLASSLRAGGKFTVMLTAVLTPEGRRIPIEILRYKQSFDDTVNMVVGAWQRHHHSLIMVENNAYQEALVQHLALRHPDIPVEGFTTTSNKHHFQLGLPGFQIQLRNGAWVVPKGGCTGAMDCQCPVSLWEEEMLSYPVGTTSDVVMAWWLTECGVRRMQGIAEQFVESQTKPPAQETVVLNPLEPGEGPLQDFEGEEIPDMPPSWLGAEDL